MKNSPVTHLQFEWEKASKLEDSPLKTVQYIEQKTKMMRKNEHSGERKQQCRRHQRPVPSKKCQTKKQKKQAKPVRTKFIRQAYHNQM